MDKVRRKLDYEHSFIVLCEGLGWKRGLALLWNAGWVVDILPSSIILTFVLKPLVVNGGS